MKIAFLGHSELILELTNNQGHPVRIMCDSWLSDYAFGDLLGRNPQLRLDYQKLPPLHAIYLTHPHCDHFDPYTLIELFSHQQPAILLPQTALYLKPLLEKYLPKPQIFVLRHGERSRLFGINFMPYLFSNPFHTNEDDVMMLGISNQNEALVYEGDTGLPDSVEAQEKIYEFMAGNQIKTRVYIDTRNELEAIFTAYDAPNAQKRKERLKNYRQARREEMNWDYERFDSGYAEYPELWQLPGMVRIHVGQGIIFPPEVDDRYLKLSAPFPMSELVSEERAIMKSYERNLEIHGHEPGMEFVIEKGKVTHKNPIEYFAAFTLHSTSLEMNMERPGSPFDRPLRNELRDIEQQRTIILDLINHRFLPYQLASLADPLKALVAAKANHRYCIEIRYGTAEQYTKRYYSYGFEDFQFVESEQFKGNVDENYWANDIEDFYNGSQDLFSNSLNIFPPEKALRFWAMLGMPFINSDLVYRKIEYHFERAARGETIGDWVRDLVGPILASQQQSSE